MSSAKKMLDREAVRTVIQQWNANRLDLFALSDPDENLLFHGVMRFYFQDAGQKVATKCIRVASDATVTDVIGTLIEKFRPDMRMLSVPNYALYEVHANGEERRLNPDEKPLLVQLNWHIDDREGRFLLKNIDQKTTPIENVDNNFKRKLSKREKKEQKKREKLAKMNSDTGSNLGSLVSNNNDDQHVAEKLYTELPETSFTRSISNPEAVMRRRRQQQLEKKLQQFRSRDGGPDTGGTLKIYGESLCRDVPYKTLLLSIRDCAQAVVREMLTKYGLDKADPLHYCLVQVNSDNTEYILDDDECPLSILMNHPTSRGSIMFHVRRRPADSQPRRRKKKPLGVSNGANSLSSEREGPMLVEVTHSGDGGRRVKLTNDPIEVGSANTNTLQLFGPSIQPRHCLISLLDGVCTVTPLHPDALTFVNGHHITQPTILHNGSVVMFGRVASYRFIDSPQDGRYNLALSQSQLDSACLYESRSPTSPQSISEEEHNLTPQNIKADFDKLNRDINHAPSENSITNSSEDNKFNKQHEHGQIKETDFTYDPEQETKSVSSIKSGGSSNREASRMPKITIAEPQQGQEPILPAVLEFPETHQENFLRQIITELDVNVPNFKLAPVYSLYLCARYRASTHYRPELQPTERAHKLTIFLHHVSNLIYSVIQEQYSDPRILAFWMANSSEFLHFLKSDRHISAFSVQAQEVLAESVQTAFRNLVNCFRMELSQTLNQFLSENIDHDSAAGLVLTVLGSAMALLRRCRVNAALTIQLFSQLFHYINVICFNTIVTNSHMCTSEWGKVMTERLHLLESWAERQGLELAADCHLDKINQCSQFLQAPKTNVEEIQQLACSCFRLNSLQMSALLSQEQIPRNLVDTAIRMAESVADELTRADGREVKLEESPELHLALLLPDDGFSCDVVRGIPSGIVDFLNPLQVAGMCRLAAQPTSIGLWTVYMHQFNARSPSSMSNKLPQPEVQVIKLHKNSNGMGLSIVAAKGAGQERLGIYIKSVVPGGAADSDGRLQAGDQLLRVDGQSLIGITQERAADYLVRTGPVVTLEVAKQGAIYHGLATLLQQPSPVIQRGNRRMSERDINRMGDVKNSALNQSFGNQNLPNSKSVPALHHGGGSMVMNNSKSRSIHSLINNNINNNGEQGFYQNLSVYRAQNQSQTGLNERIPINQNSVINNQQLPPHGMPQHLTGVQTNPTPIHPSNQMLLNRPISAYYNSNNNNNNNSNSTSNNVGTNNNSAMPSPNSVMSYNISASNNNLTTSNGMVQHQQLLPQQQQQHHQQQQQQNALAMVNRSKSTQNFTRDLQAQHSLRMNQMMAPSMPNIASHSGMTYSQQTAAQQQNHSQQMPLSQSMQNVSMMPTGNQQNVNSEHTLSFQSQNPQQYPDSLQQQQHQQQQHQQQYQMRGQTKLLEMPEMINRRNNQTLANGLDGNSLLAVGLHQKMMLHNNQNAAAIQAQMNLQKQFPPTTAPKPQYPPPHQRNQMYSQQGRDDSLPPLPPVTTHPLLKTPQITNTPGINYVASTLDPPKGAYYPVQNQHQKNFIGASNPWQREEREKEHEIRREHIRHWRDQQINDLSGLVERTPQQEDQLKALVLERDFELRAHQETVEDQDEDAENSYSKDNVQEVIRLAQQANTIQTPVTNFRQTDVKIEETTSVIPAVANLPNEAQQNYQQHLPIVQPKSILKNHQASTPASPSKSHKSASFADDHCIISNPEQTINQLTKDLGNTNLNNTSESLGHDIIKDYEPSQHSPIQQQQQQQQNPPPPPPPERNSSYLVMSQQQKIITTRTPLSMKNNSIQSPIEVNLNYDNSVKQRNTSLINNNNTLNLNSPSQNIGLTASSQLLMRSDNKRVSFHDEENNLIPSQQQDYIAEQANLEIIREDPNAFIDETTAILQSPTTPDADKWNMTVQSTPGVIGAQEVYRDPRTRRLAEQQQQKQQKSNEAVPEKLSFKEKMKMFALESGENQTPKDKLKISRAQRDIDAVH